MSRKETVILQCTGKKSNGDRCTREKEFLINEAPKEWRCWQHLKKEESNSQGAAHRLAQDKIEQIKVDLQVYSSINYIAERNNVSWETVKRIKEDYADDIENYREQKKKEFADRAWESIRDALRIGDKKLKLALEHGDDLQEIINKLLDLCKSGEVKFKKVKPLVKTLSSLADYSLRDLSTYIGTLFDKHELVQGEPTSREEINGQVTKREEYDVTIKNQLTKDEETRKALELLQRRTKGLSDGSD
ncbi:hypothetical protein [Sporohalobacter salinus]|uniref:hypothetical protein n=1 Tax=Sporohalobacter salinus TaxID=1494606 RepID=UPI0019618434|nr:hypothetical protein [Sporohalobacter salinus]MBM7623729.1 hypothetical protein [Sporohalobacter salinus]